MFRKQIDIVIFLHFLKYDWNFVLYGLAGIEFLCQIGSFDNKMALLLQVVLCARMRGRLKLHHSSYALLGS